jgi:hypothetical protein
MGSSENVGIGLMRRLLFLVVLCSAFAHAQSTYAVIITGLGGEKEFDTAFADLSTRIETGLRVSGMTPDHLILLPVAHARKEDIARAFADLAAKTKPADTLLVFLIGHGTHDGQEYKFNVLGPDPTAGDFKQWFDKVPAGRQVIVNSSSSSGAVTALWSHVGRVVITATRTPEERNATVFMRFFAEALRDPAADMDKNGIVSALEAFKYAEQRVKKFYESVGRIATEHPLLDDNGDGKGVADPSAANGEGLLAAMVPMVRFTAAKAALDTPEARELRAHKDKVENDIAELKYNKAAMEKDDYSRNLEKLLIDLARTQQALEKLEAKP